jgi:hypothetical protein
LVEKSPNLGELVGGQRLDPIHDENGAVTVMLAVLPGADKAKAGFFRLGRPALGQSSFSPWIQVHPGHQW